MSGIFEYIRWLPNENINKLYGPAEPSIRTENDQNMWACRAVFQSLSALAKSYVMRLLFISSEVPLADIQHWVNADNLKLHNQALEELFSLLIIIRLKPGEVGDENEDSANKHVPRLKMNPCFRVNFLATLSSSAKPWTQNSMNIRIPVKTEDGMDLDLGTSGAEEPQLNEQFLDNHFIVHWEKMLYYLINNDLMIPNNKVAVKDDVPDTVDNFLVYTKLLWKDEAYTGKGPNTRREITLKGFEFMLLDRYSQLWSFMQSLLLQSENQEEILSLIFMLSYCECNGQGYSLDSITASQRNLLYEISFLGIVYIPSLNSPYFYPTRMAVDMIIYSDKQAMIIANVNAAAAMGQQRQGLLGSKSQELASSVLRQSSKMTIIVESNNQVVAYVSNDLHFHMLQLFVEIDSRLPGMAIGKLTRQKCRAAFRIGISAAQIIEFLLIHTHPIIGQRKVGIAAHATAGNNATHSDSTILLPQNIYDQLCLWEKEVSRIRCDYNVIIIDMFDELMSLGSGRHSHDANHSTDVYKKLFNYVVGMKLCLWSDRSRYVFAVSAEVFPVVQEYATRLGFV